MSNPVGHALSTANVMPHDMCYSWPADALRLHVASDALIAIAYLSIPIVLVYLVRRRTDLQFNWMFQCFAAFAVVCAVTHLMDIWTIWHPSYRLVGGVKASTALASLATALLLIRLVPYALRLPRSSALQDSNTALEREVAER